MTDAQARLLRLIAERIDREQVVELHLFPAIRQGGSETGVAVVAVHPRRDGSDSLAGSNPDLLAADDTPVLVATRHDATAERLTIYSARYRLTLKGVDRGKWEADIVPEADAPLSTVDLVVRGVQRRAGELAEPERLSGDAFRAALDAPSWTLAR